MKKAFYSFVELVKTTPLIYNTLHFDQYSRLAIRLNIFRYSAIKSETILKFEKNPLVCWARYDKFIDV